MVSRRSSFRGLGITSGREETLSTIRREKKDSPVNILGCGNLEFSGW